MATYLNQALFSFYPYVCLAVFLLGSLVRFDREQYTWRSGSSQLIEPGLLRWGSNLFHVGILFLLVGHTVGLLTPHAVYEPFISAGGKQMLAIVSGGIAGVVCFVGLSMLLYRRLAYPRVRATSSTMDIAILFLLWAQLCLGLLTLPFSFAHRDGSTMLKLSEWAQRIVTFRGGAADQLIGVDWVFQAHILLGMTLFLIFPFSRLVHIWSAPIAYPLRRYQLVRRRTARSAG